VVTVLRTDQYDGLESFTEVGMFVRAFAGSVWATGDAPVAPACFALPLPDQKGQFLPLRVALIHDFLEPLGLNTNHGYGKMPIVNSEVAKKRTALEKRLRNVERWMASARGRSHNASRLYDRLVARKPRPMAMSCIASSTPIRTRLRR
jgi:hypothetical protein